MHRSGVGAKAAGATQPVVVDDPATGNSTGKPLCIVDVYSVGRAEIKYITMLT